MLSNPRKATNAPPTAVFLQPKWSVNMLTTGEQKKIIPMASAPTHAGARRVEADIEGKKERKKERKKGQRKRQK